MFPPFKKFTLMDESKQSITSANIINMTEKMYLLKESELKQRDKKFYENGIHYQKFENGLYKIELPPELHVPSEKEISFMACEESQQDWNDLGYKKTADEYFQLGAKWAIDLLTKRK